MMMMIIMMMMVLMNMATNEVKRTRHQNDLIKALE